MSFEFYFIILFLFYFRLPKLLYVIYSDSESSHEALCINEVYYCPGQGSS